MKFTDTEFSRQLATVIFATAMFVASVAWICIPASIGCIPGSGSDCASVSVDRHLS